MSEIADQPEPARGGFTLADALSLALLAFLISIVLAASWGRWLDPITDTGRDLYIPEKLVEGKLLYRDFQYYYPPVAPYLLAAGTLLVGSDLSGYTILGCAVGLAVAITLYLILRMIAGRAAATAGAALFVTLNLTAASNWGSNFIFPYAHAATFGIMFLLLYLFFLLRYLFHDRNPTHLALAFVCGALAAGSKIEFASIVAVSFIYAVVVHRIPGKLVAAAATAAGVLGLVSWAVFGGGPEGRHWLRDNILLLITQHSSVEFYAAVQGADRLWENLGKSVHGAAVTLAITALLAGLHRALRSNVRGRKLTAVALAVGVLVVSVYGSDYIFFRGWSVLQLILVPLAIRKPRSPLPLLLGISLLSSSRIFFNLSPVWYGFFLILPVYLLILYVLFDLLPSYGVYSRRLALGWIPLLAILMFRAQLHQREIWSHCVHPVETARGTYLDWNRDRAQVISEFVRGAGGARSLVVIPESPTLNYFTRIENPMPYQAFTPFISDVDWMERDMIAAFAETKPEYVAFVDRPVTEFGYRGFGIDYNERLAAHIRSNYAEVRSWRRPAFSLVLLRRLGR